MLVQYALHSRMRGALKPRHVSQNPKVEGTPTATPFTRPAENRTPEVWLPAIRHKLHTDLVQKSHPMSPPKA